MTGAYTRHCTRAKAQGFKPLQYHQFISLAGALA